MSKITDALKAGLLGDLPMKKTRGMKFRDALVDDVDDRWYQQVMMPIPKTTVAPTAAAMQAMQDKYVALINSQMNASIGQMLNGSFSIVEEKPPSIDSAKLEELKAAEPYKVQRRMPDFVHALTAWRAWAVVNESGWRLKALGMNGIWQPKKAMEAECQKSDPTSLFAFSPGRNLKVAVGKHPAPSFNCTCGIWSFKELDGLVAAIGSQYEVKVLGQVELWGRVIETENGYRAEKAYPKELWLLDDSLEELGFIYDVPVRMIKPSR